MKKLLVLACITGLAGLALAQQPNLATTESMLLDPANVWDAASTNYVGKVQVNINTTATPSVNDAKWYITRTKIDASGAVLEVKHAYGDGLQDRALWTTAWTNRVAATYK